MDKKSIDRLYEKGLLSDEKREQLNAIADRSLLSMYYELRTLLYVGVLLLSGGLGLLIYNNLGQIGHYVSLAALSLLTIACFLFVEKRRLPFSRTQVESENPYFDYALLLGCLLFISVLGYVQFLFGWFTGAISLISLLSAILYFYMAYRHDHLGVLSLGITAFASFLGLAISPMKWWYEFDFYADEGVQWIAVVYGIVLFFGALLLSRLNFKSHFTKTYLNFGVIIAFTGSSTLMLSRGSDQYVIGFLQIILAVLLAVYSFKQRTVLYFIYAYVFGFYALTYILANALETTEVVFWLVYTLAVSAGFIVMILRLRNRFKHDT